MAKAWFYAPLAIYLPLHLVWLMFNPLWLAHIDWDSVRAYATFMMVVGIGIKVFQEKPSDRLAEDR